MIETGTHTTAEHPVQVGEFTETVRRLNTETDLEAQKWFREKQKILFPVVLWRAFRRFVSIYFFEGRYRDGFFGFMRAVNGSLYQLMSYAKYWELMERERGRM